MPKPNKFVYEKKQAFRDAYYFIIVCEGQNREPNYFKFFDGMSSRLKVVPVESRSGASSPTSLVHNAILKERELDVNPDTDVIWFVIDTDMWREQLHELRAQCQQKKHWSVAQSNPCFEVWLHFHAYNKLPDKHHLQHIDRCNNWKPYVGAAITGGFNCDFHPIAIEAAALNAKANYREEGYAPLPGSTQVWKLAEELLKVIQKDLQVLKSQFPTPEPVG